MSDVGERWPETVRLADGHVDLRRGLVVRATEPVRLTALECELLRYLASHPGRPVDRDELLSEVWEYGPGVTTRAVDNTVSRLRRKLERTPSRPLHLQSARGRGYSLVPARSQHHGPPLIGREADIQQLGELLEPGTRLTLTGPAGVGKSSLARAVGAQLGGQPLAVDAKGCGTAELAMRLARACDLASATVALDESLLAALRARGAAVLIIDNAETALPVVGEILDWLRAPDLRVIITSRVALERADERQWRVDALDRAACHRLFLARARDATGRDDLVVDETLLESITSHLDGLPLAIELCAARCRVLTPEELLGRLGDKARLLRDRDRALWSELAISWSLLDDDERRVLSTLVVFAGGFTADAVEQVTEELTPPDAPWVIDTLDRLIRHSLVQRQGTRFALLESVSEFVTEHTGSQTLNNARHAHARWCVRLLESGDVQRIDAEASNLSTGLRHAPPALAATLAAGWVPHLFRNGAPSLLLDVVTLGLASAAPAEAATLCEHQALCLRSMGRIREARAAQTALESILSARSQSATAAEHHAPLLNGLLCRSEGDPAGAEASFLAARPAAQAFDELGALYYEQSRHAEAADAYRQALDEYRAQDDLRGEARALARLATLELERGDLAAAQHHLLGALRRQEQLGDHRQQAIVRSHLGLLLHEQGELTASRQHWRRSLETHERLGNRRFHGFALAGLGLLAIEEGRLAAAQRRLHAALEIFERVGDRAFEGVVWARLALLHHVDGRPEAARSAWNRSDALLDRHDWGRRGVLVLDAVLSDSPIPEDAVVTSFERLLRRVALRHVAECRNSDEK